MRIVQRQSTRVGARKLHQTLMWVGRIMRCKQPVTRPASVWLSFVVVSEIVRESVLSVALHGICPEPLHVAFWTAVTAGHILLRH